jgi:protein involved in ribonucleotide reduction
VEDTVSQIDKSVFYRKRGGERRYARFIHVGVLRKHQRTRKAQHNNEQGQIYGAAGSQDFRNRFGKGRKQNAEKEGFHYLLRFDLKSEKSSYSGMQARWNLAGMSTANRRISG